MIKLIVTDMDGTLLDDNKKIDESFWEVHKKITELGIQFVVASGRQYYNIIKNFERLNNKNIIVMAENGAIVMEGEKEIYSQGLPMKDAIELIEVGRKIPTAHLVFCGKKKAYLENNDEDFIKEVEKYYEKYEIVEDLTKVDDIPLKVTICDLTGSEKNSYPYYKKYEEIYKVAISGEIWLDITEKNVNKGIALKNLQEKLGIKKSETMVFGDFLNDYELIQQGDYSFVMDNGHPELKKIAKYSGGDNNKAGVVNSIKKYILEK
ncbi:MULTISPECIES: HAD family hydrolase [Fusobacterium]|uniref:HAD family hydrolase n=1 Tax=Fusobacterium TaxID=848 RepID=UPI0014774B35|nr:MULTISPECIES: HAD family hydrolase [Fusobacterium]NME35400.1 HAD family phosphatase [Fusobacterium sp. FSA-380-WT-3A]